MGRKPGTFEGNPELERLQVEERQAEVEVKKARAEAARADAEKKKRDAGIGAESEISDKIHGGITHDHYVFINRRPAGAGAYKFWKGSIPLDEIDSVEAYIQAEGDPGFDHMAIIKDTNGKKIGKTVYFPAEDSGHTEASSSLSALDRELKELDRKLEEKKKRKQAEKKRRKLEEDEEEDEESERDEEFVYVPHLGGYFPKGSPMALGMMMPGMMPPWMQPPQKEKEKDSVLETLVPVLVAWISKEQKDPIQSILPLLMHKGDFQPKDMVSMFSPIITEMSKSSIEGNRTILDMMARMDSDFRRKVLDLVLADKDRSPEEVEKWQRWLSFGESAIRKTAGIVRDSLKGVPAAEPKKNIEQKRPPGLPGPKKEGEEQTASAGEGGNKAAEGKPQTSDPAAAAAQIKRQRVQGFLEAVETEMHAESDPILVAKACVDLYLAMPKSIRDKVEKACEDDPPSDEKLVELLVALKELCPEIVERMTGVVMENVSYQEWLKELLVECAFPEDEEGGEEEAAEGEPEPAPEKA